MTDERIIAYLLDELPEEEAGQFEEACFAQARWPRQIKRVEEDLIVTYLRGELSPEQHAHFEQNYLTTEARAKRVLTAAALLRVMDDPPEGEARGPVTGEPNGRSWLGRLIGFWNSLTWGLPAVAALGLLVIAGAWWLSRPSTPAQPTVATLTLAISADVRRGAGDQPASVKLSPGVDALSVRLTLPEPAAMNGPPSRVELIDQNEEVRSLAVEAREAGAVTVVIPAAQLKRGLYSLRLFTTNADGREQRVSGSYVFVVVE
jgi:anti-sigma factor RsiW